MPRFFAANTPPPPSYTATSADGRIENIHCGARRSLRIRNQQGIHSQASDVSDSNTTDTVVPVLHSRCAYHTHADYRYISIPSGTLKKGSLSPTSLHLVSVSATDSPESARSEVKRPKLTLVTPEPNKRKKGIKGKMCKQVDAPRSESFPPLWSGTVHHILKSPISSLHADLIEGAPIEPHTLILGTHPSITSLEQQEYYGHPMNAFWWIAGDCLGFRRDRGLSKSRSVSCSSGQQGRPYKFTSFLRYDGPIHSYSEQVQLLISKGFALWDVVASCHRPGSLDQDIVDEVPNDIWSFCNQHKSIRRIVLTNGGSTLKLFCKHFGDWVDSGELELHQMTKQADGAREMKIGNYPISAKYQRALCRSNEKTKNSSTRITLIPALSVSPAAAKCSYQEKRDFWEQYVYQTWARGLSKQL